MGRTLNELVRHLKDMIEDMQSDAHNTSSFNRHRYNNLKIEIPESSTARMPIFKISIGISEATYNIKTLEKISGSLGQDEKYINKWLKNSTVVMDLKEAWKSRSKVEINNSGDGGKTNFGG